MNSELTIEELAASVLRELEKLHYQPGTIQLYRSFYKRLAAFAKSVGEERYSEDLGQRYMRDRYGPVCGKCDESSGRDMLSFPMRCLRVIGDYRLHGVILRRKKTKDPYDGSPEFKRLLAEYEEDRIRKGLSFFGRRGQSYLIRTFLEYLDGIGVDSPSSLTPRHLADYVRTTAGLHPKSTGSALTAVRAFLRFLHLEGHTERDLSADLPAVRNTYRPRIPRSWNPEDVRRLLESVDRGNPAGKRDYAMLLMLARLGMRMRDLCELRLADLKWDEQLIEIAQSKTGRGIRYPLLEDVGWAVVDYLKNGRPPTDSPCLFVRHNAPVQGFANPESIMAKHIRRAGIRLPRGASHGMHSLRHTLAGVLLEQDTPLPVISEILGHASTFSTGVYLGIDLENLRRCALDPDGVFHDDDLFG